MKLLSNTSMSVRGLALLLPVVALVACDKAAAPGAASAPIAASTGTSVAVAPANPAATVAPAAAEAMATAPAASAMAATPATPATPAPSAKSAGAGGAAPYTVEGGTKVDPATMEGFRTWRAAACDRCHGANQEGMVGPSLIASLKTLSKQDFTTTVLEGRLAKGMPTFKTSPQVVAHIDDLYAYLKGRSDGAITAAKVSPIQ